MTAMQETVKPNYNPTPDELNVAISVALKQEPSANPKQVLTSLQEEHPTWKLPERRVTKFVKKQIKTSKKEVKDSVTHEEESVSSQSSKTKRMAQSTKKKLGNVLKRVKSKKGKSDPVTPEQTTKPPTHIHTDVTAVTDIVSPISSPGEEETTAKVETPKEEEKEEVDKPEVPRDLSVVYEDDNDGSKEKQFCGDFCACAVM